MKSKKFNAAEKQFMESIETERKRNKVLKRNLENALSEIESQKKLLTDMGEKNKELADENRMLMSVKGLSEEDLKKLVKSASSVNAFVSLIGKMKGAL